MATTQQVQEQVEACAREMMAAFDAIDDSEALSWLDAVESRAVEIGDAIAVELVKRKSADCPVAQDELTCPQCGKQGQHQGQRQRPLVTRRGATTIAEPKYFCPCCRKAFFPLTQAIGVEVDCPFTPAVLRKVVYAGSQSAAFVPASKDLKALAEVKASREQVQRWTKRVGEERVSEVERAAEAYEQLPLPEQRKSPTVQVPQVACVQMDGGRIQIRDRQENPKNQTSKGYWRETLVGCCLRMTSEEHAVDPCPTIPETFVDPRRMNDLSREIKGFSGDAEAAEGPPQDSPADRDGVPKVLVKSVVATRQGVDAFGKQLVAEAHSRGFHAAPRKAFVSDGSATNWGVHRKHFSHYTPILDFTHAICYVYAAAMAGRTGDAAWRDYVAWAQWLWAGSTTELIAAVAARSKQLGPPDKDDVTSPAAIVAKTLGYLKNQRPRMKYSQYRQLGLPITSSHVESAIKQINRRVKGTEKFWRQGAEPLLRLAADHISETDTLDRFWKNRHQRLRPTRRYQTAA